ncbi:hypothetical protein GDO78_012947 [Eleutherodactylus coqui]|uniref:Uncharacterized protein n=1 Tax=Eleutherodactylus coqui TaxID=57060 RepID=A0A8J6EXT0_ELECQ|nr:hypothetical protein GDO78_012947 [Eleutherodactylus coqui]
MERSTQSCSAAASLDQQHATIPVSLPAPGLRPCSVWILGNAFITSVLRRASKLPDGRQLGFPRSKAVIRWLEHKHLPWVDVIPTVLSYANKYGPPDILVVHAGESDLISKTTKILTQYIQGDLLSLRSMFPGAVVVWSHMVCRRKTPAENSQKKLDQACIKINNAVSMYLEGSGIMCINHSRLFGESSDFFGSTDDTLTAAGKDICRIDIQEGIEKALQLWQQSHALVHSLMLLSNFYH